MIANIKFESAAFRENVTSALIEGDRLRRLRLPFALVLAAFLAIAADPPIALAWASLVLASDFALMFAIDRLQRDRGNNFHLGASLALATMLNAGWAGGPVAVWLYNPALADTAAFWLAGHVVYQVIFFRKSFAYFAISAAPHALALLWVAAASKAGEPGFAAHMVVVVLLLAMLGVGAARRASIDGAMERSEAELRRRQKLADDLSERLQLAVDASGSVVWGIDFPEKRMFGQGPLCKMLGARFGYEDFMAGRLPPMHEEDKSAVATAFVASMKSGAKIEVEHRIQHPDLGERWLRVTGVARRDRTGRLLSLVMLSNDVTERRRLRMDFAEAMARAETSLASKRALVQRLAGDFGVAAAPVAPKAGAEEQAPRNWDYKALHARLGRLLSEIDSRDAALTQSIDQLRAARATAEAASQAKTRFVAHMTHELRTPLNAVIGFSEILEEDLAEAQMGRQARDVARIKSAAHNLLSLVNAVLDLAKIEAGAMEAHAADINLPLFLTGIAREAGDLAKANNNRFELITDPAVTLLATDEPKLRQCVVNLVSNACRFTQGGAVTLELRAAGPGRVAFAVTDTGMGMSRAKLAQLFQPFSQGEEDFATRRNDGAGLGLAIAQRLAQLLDGEITVSSVEGQGSVFTLTVASQLDSDEGEDERLGPGADGRIVLVIDDEANSRRLVRHTLARVGLGARSAATATAGLDLAQRIDPALIVLDIRLPDRSGWDVLTELHANPKTAHIPVLVLSIEDDRGRALSLGACEHFTKPADRAQLAAAIVRCARGAVQEKPADESRPAWAALI